MLVLRLICKQSSKQVGEVARYREGVLTFHANEWNPHYRHCCVQCVESKSLPAAVRREQEYARRV